MRKKAANSESGPSSVSTCALTYHHSVADERWGRSCTERSMGPGAGQSAKLIAPYVSRCGERGHVLCSGVSDVKRTTSVRTPVRSRARLGEARDLVDHAGPDLRRQLVTHARDRHQPGPKGARGVDAAG